MHQGAGADCTMCDVFGNYKQVGSVLDAVCKAAYAFHAMELVQFYAIHSHAHKHFKLLCST